MIVAEKYQKDEIMQNITNKYLRSITGIAYFVCLYLGIKAAYDERWIPAMFWAITCAGESIAVSIDRLVILYKQPEQKEKE